MKYIDEYIRTEIIKVGEPGKPEPTGGFWYVYAVCSSRLFTHTHLNLPHTRYLA